MNFDIMKYSALHFYEKMGLVLWQNFYQKVIMLNEIEFGNLSLNGVECGCWCGVVWEGGRSLRKKTERREGQKKSKKKTICYACPSTFRQRLVNLLVECILLKNCVHAETSIEN